MAGAERAGGCAEGLLHGAPPRHPLPPGSGNSITIVSIHTTTTTIIIITTSTVIIIIIIIIDIVIIIIISCCASSSTSRRCGGRS